MRIVRDEIDGYRTCARPRTLDDTTVGIVLDADCPGYASEPCKVVREESEITFRDSGAVDTLGMNVDMVERSTVRFLPADGESANCRHCGFPASFSERPRPTYARVSGQDPDELRRRTLRGDARADQQVSAAERQAGALEKLVEQGEENSRVAQLEAQLAELMARIDNGGDE